MWRNFMQTFSCTAPESKQLLLWLSTNLNTGLCPVDCAASLHAWHTKAAFRNYSGDQIPPRAPLACWQRKNLLWQMWAVEVEANWGASSGARSALACAMLPCSGMGICSAVNRNPAVTEERPGGRLSFMKSQKWRQCGTEQIPFFCLEPF